MMMRLRSIVRRKSFATLTGALILAISSVAVASAITRGSRDVPAARPAVHSLQAAVAAAGKPHARSEIRRVPRLLVAHFGLFRHRRTHIASALPTQVSELLAPMPWGLNLALTQTTQTNGGSVWVSPGNGVLCVTAAPDGSDTPLGASCSTYSAAVIGDAYLIAGRVGQPTLVAGIAPDGVANVVVTRADGTKLSLPVTNNVYSGTVAGFVSNVDVAGTDFRLP